MKGLHRSFTQQQDRYSQQSYIKEFYRSNSVQSYIHLVRQLVLHPSRFFAEAPSQENVFNPLLFALICAEIATIFKGMLKIILMEMGVPMNSKDFFYPAGAS
jgi:hypothetical protein